MTLKGKSKIIQSSHANTQYLTIPSAITRDSQYPFKNGDEVEIIVDPIRKLITVVSGNSLMGIKPSRVKIDRRGKGDAWKRKRAENKEE